MVACAPRDMEVDVETLLPPVASTRVPRPTARRKLPRLLAVGLVVFSLLGVTILPSLAQDATPTPGGAAVTSEGIDLSIPETLGGTFNFGISSDVGTFDPIQPMSNMSLWTVMELYSRLVRVDKFGQDVEGELAQSWETSPDGTIWTFHLNPDAKFSTGDPVTAEDVVYSFERAMGPDSANAWVFDGVEAVEMIDPQTIEITISRPAASFLNSMTLWGASIVSKAAVEGGTDPATEPVGSGPFMLESWEPGVQVTLLKNPHYWETDEAGNQLPYVDQVNLIVLSEDNTRMLKLQAGEIDAAMDVPYNQIAPLSQDPNLDVVAAPLYGLVNIGLSQSKPELTDIKIRQAMNYAIDREAIVQTALFGSGRPACSPINLTWFYTDKYCYTYDLEKAKQLMAESSAPDGFEVTLSVGAGFVVDNQIAVMIKDMLAQIGVDVVIEPVDPTAQFDRFVKGDFEMTMLTQTSDNLDPDTNLLYCCVSDGGANSYYTGWKDPEVDALYRDSQVEMDFAKRNEILDEFQRLVMERGPFIEVVNPTNRYASRTTTHNFFMDPTAHWHLEYVWKE
jgi:peptide/nickel transport system substrate-binding protein